MDYTYSAHQMHRQRSDELGRVVELRRLSEERREVGLAAAVPAEAVREGWWHRTLRRWHLAPRPAH